MEPVSHNDNYVRIKTHEPVEICHVVDISLKRAKDRFFLKNVSITKSYTPGHFVRGNAEKLALAFLNIIINAIESMQNSEGKLWVAVYRTEEDIKVVFKDNGSGMDPELASRIFESGFSNKPGGFGIGLTHVKDILDEHRASVTVVSKSGTGTSVILTFNAL